MPEIDPRHDECHRCLFYNRRHRNPNCRDCDAGEFFEERVNERALPTNRELRELVSRVRSDDE